MIDAEMKLRIQILKLQRDNLLRRYEARKKRVAFVKKNLTLINKLSMDGWPRTRNMKDYIKWFDLIMEAKIKGIYSIGSANCDVIAMLNNIAKELNTINN